MLLKEIQLQESIEDKGIFKAMFMVGSPGSGKTYVQTKITGGGIEPRIVNTDKFIEHYGRTGTDISNPRSQLKILGQSKHLTQSQLTLYINGMLPLIVDSTSSQPTSTLRRVGLLESLGYDIIMCGVITDVDVAIERAKQRERYVDPEYIRRTHKKTEANIRYYKTRFPHFITIPNNDGELTDDVILDGFRKSSRFFNSPPANPIGQERIEQMKSEGIKYLSPEIVSIDQIKAVVNTWYNV